MKQPYTSPILERIGSFVDMTNGSNFWGFRDITLIGRRD
ncbi:hypothetical protein NORO109296_05675 [Nocardiopsis rhodophaea]